MEKELDINIIKATQSSLGKHIKRPPLSEKLLRKPPFRFLHDIITNVIKSTGFFDGLFNENELISDNVKDRDSKILFLHKVISVLALTTGTTLSAKPSKIVAGQEPEKTNELLQCLGQALDKKLKSSDAVKKYKENSKNENKKEKSEIKIKEVKVIDNKNTSKSNDKLPKTKNESSERPERKDKDKKPSKSLKTTQLQVNEKEKSKVETKKHILTKKQTEHKNVKEKTIAEPSSNHNNIKDELETSKNYDHTTTTDTIIENKELSKNIRDHEIKSKIIEDTLEKNEITSVTNGLDALSNGNKLKHNGELIEIKKSIKQDDGPQNILKDSNGSDGLNKEIIDNQNTLITDENLNIQNDKSIENQNSVKETYEPNKQSQEIIEHNTAKDKTYPSKENNGNNQIENELASDTTTIAPTDNDIKNNADKVQIETKLLRPPSARPSSSRPGAPRLRERHDDTYVTPDNLIVGKVNIIVENTPNEEEDESIIVDSDPKINGVQNIESLQSISNQHGHLVQQILESQKELSKTATGKTEIEWEFDAQKTKESSSLEVEQMRLNIEALSRIANPMGKLLDHIQEDVEVMRQELQQWTEQYELAANELNKQKSINVESLQPFLTKSNQLDADIKEKQEKINDLKVIIYRNTSRINSLLSSGDVQ